MVPCFNIHKLPEVIRQYPKVENQLYEIDNFNHFDACSLVPGVFFCPLLAIYCCCVASFYFLSELSVQNAVHIELCTILIFIGCMKNEYVVKKESFFRNYGDLLPENYKAWYKFIEPDTTLSGFTDKVLYYTHYKTGLIRKLTRFLRQITKVLYELWLKCPLTCCGFWCVPIFCSRLLNLSKA